MIEMTDNDLTASALKMSEFIDRFLKIRNVVRNIFEQIDDLDIFLFKRAQSLGMHHRESFDAFERRLKDPCTHTFGYERENYVYEVEELLSLRENVQNELTNLGYIYENLLEILRCEPICDGLRIEDNPDEDIMKSLRPRVHVGNLLEAIHMDWDLAQIVDRIYVVMYHDDAFHIRGRDDLWRELRSNRLPMGLETEYMKQWPDDVGRRC
jgi:hypothetical protein